MLLVHKNKHVMYENQGTTAKPVPQLQDKTFFFFSREIYSLNFLCVYISLGMDKQYNPRYLHLHNSD